MNKARLLAACEYAAIFLAMPAIIYFCATRWNVHLALWLVALYALIRTWRIEKPSWPDLWHGTGWSVTQRKAAALRFVVATALIIFLTYLIAPQRMFMFPLVRPGFWLIVMVLYPILSVIPQEFVFRSYFFRRYRDVFRSDLLMQAMSAFSFALVHIVFHNPVSPTLCLIAGAFFTHSYSQHKSLKWVVIEHAAYGCMVFTVGIGFYFLVGGGSIKL